MRDDLRLPAVADRLVAWHNRHPLARRISTAQVHAVGYVGLPFVCAAGTGGAMPAAAPPVLDDALTETVEGAAPEAGSLRERALARARQPEANFGAAPQAPAVAHSDLLLPALAALQPDFSEDFIDPLRPRAVARFAAKVGQVLGRPPGDGPVRQIAAGGAHPDRAPAWVYLLTAVIETDTRKSRVLLGTGLSAPVLGRRILSTPRLLGVATLAALLVGVPTWLLRPIDTPQAAAPVPQVALGAASAAASAGAFGASAAASGPQATAVVAVALAASSVASVTSVASASSASSVASGVAAPAVPALAGSSTQAPSSIRPLISDADKAAARLARQQAGSAPAAAAIATPNTVPAATPAAVPPTALPKPTALPTPAPAPAVRTAVPPAPAPPQRTATEPPPAPPPRAVPAAAQPQPPAGTSAFALSTRPLRTRAEAEQVMVAMQALLRTVGAADVKVDVLPQGDDWRVVGWPFPRRADADKARALLVSRGMRVEVVDF